MKKLLPLLFVLAFVSCDKDEMIEFKKVDVQQSGELVRVSGYLLKPVNYEFSYSVRVQFCDKYEDFLVTILPGQTTGYRDYVTDNTVKCRFSPDYVIQWQTNLEQ